ncbi:hypothetical protein M0R72_05790 [Candidatus Pacearchaeota archaeon]|jgi:hypothetical protein|nr:hypothetical protein [Candidatus Pacearchaeota archaeon]
MSDIIDAKWAESEFCDGSKKHPTAKNPITVDPWIYWYGDSDLTGQELPAKIYYYMGVLIIEPDDVELREMNRIDNNDIYRAIRRVPTILRNCIDAVQINPYAEEDDSARAQADGATIILFGYQSAEEARETTDELPYIFVHEAAHLYDISNGRISRSDAYREAMSLDGNHASSYSQTNMVMDGIGGRNGKAEDFAESVALYVQYRPKFEKRCPHRAKFIRMRVLRRS